MSQENKTARAIEAIETVLATEFETEIASTQLRRISKEFSKFGGVRE